MIRLLVYLLLFSALIYWLYGFFASTRPSLPEKPSNRKFRSPVSRRDWAQVYETALRDEALRIQARLEEEGIECIVYEQGKKDIYGKPLPGIGVSVPKPSLSLAQKIISRLPV
ncbi:MAG TPA: hypothetical protein PKL97_03235 [Candidatus Omnitrophota bacterium]|nr:hypothetical protein [Candidatus Omnitrophota bacterium]